MSKDAESIGGTSGGNPREEGEEKDGRIIHDVEDRRSDQAPNYPGDGGYTMRGFAGVPRKGGCSGRGPTA